MSLGAEPGSTETDRGILDTSVLVDLPRVDPKLLPQRILITCISLAELAAGPHAVDDPGEQARRQERLQLIETSFDALPFDSAAARSYGRIVAAVRASGRTVRRRLADYLIASIALSQGLPLFTRNAGDLTGLEGLIEIREV